jgi:hypothetical protein
MFKFALTIATSAFLFMLGATDLFAMELDDDHSAIRHSVPADVMGTILKEASKDNNPRHLTSVCKFWYSVIRENQDTQQKLQYTTMNPFMQECMNTYWEHQFYNGILHYTPTDGSNTVTLKFADLNEEGTFDLSACGNTGQYLIITTSMDRFFKIEGGNKDKTVILVTPRSLVEQGINTSPSHPFAAHMAGWNADKASVGMFWRWGNDMDLSWVDYLTTSSMTNISSKNLYENWRASRRWLERWTDAVLGGHANFMSVFEPK